MDRMTPQTPARTSSREKVLAALLAAVGAALVLISVGRSWAHGTMTDPVRLSVSASGSDLTGVPYALGLAGLAGAVALFAVRRVGRYMVGAVLAAAGVGTAAIVAAKLGNLDSALLTKATQAAVATDAPIAGVGNSAWPYVTVAGGLLLAVSGGYTLMRGRSWTSLSSRYERTAPAPEAGSSAQAGPRSPAEAEPSSRDLWDALNQGADPTV
jgi:uncharacterized membrane protein (TIGR02234 family)